MQVDEQALKGRFIAYKDVKPELKMSLTYIRRLIMDLCLTIEVHPIALGIKSEVSVQYFIRIPASTSLAITPCCSQSSFTPPAMQEWSSRSDDHVTLSRRWSLL